MPQIALDLTKSVEQNASAYYELSKRFKKKKEGGIKAVAELKQQLTILEKERAIETANRNAKIQSTLQSTTESMTSASMNSSIMNSSTKTIKKINARLWYDNFRWFFSSEGFLCVGGRDSTTNDILIKKHAEKEDLIFHTEMPGSPFFVIKTGGKIPTEITLQETAEATGAYSRAWKLGIAVVDTYHITPSQVTKTSPEGIQLPAGSFYIDGKKIQHQVQMKIAVGSLPNGKIMGGPVSAIKKNCENFIVVSQGSFKSSDVIKQIAKELKISDIDAIARALPTGGIKIQKQQR